MFVLMFVPSFKVIQYKEMTLRLQVKLILLVYLHLQTRDLIR